MNATTKMAASEALAGIFGQDAADQIEAEMAREERACFIPVRVLDSLCAGYRPEIFGTLRKQIGLRPDARHYKQYAQMACRLVAAPSLDADDYARLASVANGGNWRD